MNGEDAKKPKKALYDIVTDNNTRLHECESKRGVLCLLIFACLFTINVSVHR